MHACPPPQSRRMHAWQADVPSSIDRERVLTVHRRMDEPACAPLRARAHNTVRIIVMMLGEGGREGPLTGSVSASVVAAALPAAWSAPALCAQDNGVAHVDRLLEAQADSAASDAARAKDKAIKCRTLVAYLFKLVWFLPQVRRAALRCAVCVGGGEGAADTRLAS